MEESPSSTVRHTFPMAVAIALVAMASTNAASQPSVPDEPASSAQPPLTSSAARRVTLDFWTFRDLPYYEPLTAEPRAARMEVTIPAWAKQFPHSEESGTRFAWQVTAGRELPILGVRSENVDGRVGKGQWGVGLWTPI